MRCQIYTLRFSELFIAEYLCHYAFRIGKFMEMFVFVWEAVIKIKHNLNKMRRSKCKLCNFKN